MWTAAAWERSVAVRRRAGQFTRHWGLSMKNRHGGNLIARHNPKHVSEMHLKAPHIIAAYARTGKPLVVKRRGDA